VTDAVPILNVDLRTCTPADLSFSSPFRLRASRRDRVHSLVAYFECAFTQCSPPLGFSTAPSAQYTHWKQTIFYLREPVEVGEGEELRGTISCLPNARNARDLDIALVLNFDGAHGKLTDKRVEYRLR
jgi:protein arginine N-methyltransferase 1